MESLPQLSEARSFRICGFHVEPSALRVSGDGRVVRLEPKTMQVLVYLASKGGRVISRAELEQHIWEGRMVGEDALTNTISKLRRTFADNARDPRVIETLPKTGYRLMAEVEWFGQQPKASQAGEKRADRPFSRSSRQWIGAVLFLALFAGAMAWMLLQQDATLEPEIALRGTGPGERPTVAILPFDNLGGEADQDYFANGLTSNLITDLSKVSGLQVIAPGSVFSYRDTTSGTQQISRELNTDYVVRGSVQRQSERVRINAQLFEADSEQALWAERYEGGISDVFRLQDQVATAVIAALSVELSPGEQNIFSRYPTESVEAYDLFLRGLEAYGHRTPDSNRSAREYFAQALEIDPDFGRAIAGLALVHSREAIDGWSEKPSDSMSLAVKYAEKAALSNPTIPQIHFVTGQVALFRGEHRKAIAATQRAIDYSPNYADAYALQAWIMNYAGQPNEAFTVLQTAIRLNPVIPASYAEILGEIRYLQGRHGEAIAAFNRALQINPAHMRARMWLIAVLAQSGNTDEMEWQVAELEVSNPGFSMARLDYAFPFRDPLIREGLVENLQQASLAE
ncbi:winged helix-turn-helix domain-containing protein [Candidatus Thiodiazotropha sp. CDECU1]|uniref:winged helix-turn-helix domain-containing protein n=1 Tax=Candidatus Thiodiazotropha sp. CDECU1 TaxID=3065865 RepID=UPI00292E22F5|nr:winged helix-turn-helix domain-containing protein [Candidatus Thiodiazotropha sp. CDECU1]